MAYGFTSFVNSVCDEASFYARAQVVVDLYLHAGTSKGKESLLLFSNLFSQHVKEACANNIYGCGLSVCNRHPSLLSCLVSPHSAFKT